MSVAALIRSMANAGAPPEAIAIAVEAIEASYAIVAERKAADARKTALYRQRGGGRIPEDMRQAVYERDGFRCVYCGSEDNLTCDHVTAVSKGGGTTFENLATACRSCNSRKRDRDRKYVQRHSADIPRTDLDIPQNVQADLSPKETSPTPPKEITPFPASLRSVSGSAGERAFDRFWKAWPHKVGKPAAERSFAKVAHEIEAILAGIANYIREKPPDRPWLNPATFLNQRRWEDEPAKVADASRSNATNPEKSVHAAAKKLCDDIASGELSFGEPPPSIAEVLARDRERERENRPRLLSQG